MTSTLQLNKFESSDGRNTVILKAGGRIQMDWEGGRILHEVRTVFVQKNSMNGYVSL